MAVRSSFDQWQKDVFFSAAEEVQESADIMESMYRMWVRERSDGFKSEILDELRKELHTALGTAKWQLEEFARASYESCSSEENTSNRHREFVSAIENQISRVEKALSDSLVEEGKQPLRWVQLNEEEREDLAIFLSAAPQPLPKVKDEFANNDVGITKARAVPEPGRGFKETLAISKDAKYVVEVAENERSKGMDAVAMQEENINGPKRTRSSPDISAWKIVIDDEESNRKVVEARQETPSQPSSLCGLLRNVECTAKLKWFRNSLPKVKSGEHLNQSRQGFSNYLDLKGFTRFAQKGINGLSERGRSCFSDCKEDSKMSNIQQIVGRVGGIQRHLPGSQYYMQYGRSLRVTLLLVLTIFLIVPFVLYST